ACVPHAGSGAAASPFLDPISPLSSITRLTLGHRSDSCEEIARSCYLLRYVVAYYGVQVASTSSTVQCAEIAEHGGVSQDLVRREPDMWHVRLMRDVSRPSQPRVRVSDKESSMADVSPQGQEPEQAGLRFEPLARLMLWLGITSAAFVVFVIVVPVNPWFPEATREAGEVDNLFKFMLAASGVIFIYVQGLLLAFALRYRRRKNEPDDAVGPTVHGHTGLEMAWSAVPALLLLVLAVLSLRVWSDEHAFQKDPLQLGVKGFQFGWTFSLRQYGIGFDKNLSTVTIP